MIGHLIIDRVVMVGAVRGRIGLALFGAMRPEVYDLIRDVVWADVHDSIYPLVEKEIVP